MRKLSWTPWTLLLQRPLVSSGTDYYTPNSNSQTNQDYPQTQRDRRTTESRPSERCRFDDDRPAHHTIGTEFSSRYSLFFGAIRKACPSWQSALLIHQRDV